MVGFLTGVAHGDDAHDQIVREKGFELLRACNKGYPLVGAWEIDFCESYRYLQRRSVRQDRTPAERLQDEDDVIEYMITKEFFLDCDMNVRPAPTNETEAQLTNRLKFCSDYAKTHAKAAKDRQPRR